MKYLLNGTSDSAGKHVATPQPLEARNMKSTLFIVTVLFSLTAFADRPKLAPECKAELESIYDGLVPQRQIEETFEKIKPSLVEWSARIEKASQLESEVWAKVERTHQLKAEISGHIRFLDELRSLHPDSEESAATKDIVERSIEKKRAALQELNDYLYTLKKTFDGGPDSKIVPHEDYSITDKQFDILKAEEFLKKLEETLGQKINQMFSRYENNQFRRNDLSNYSLMNGPYTFDPKQVAFGIPVHASRHEEYTGFIKNDTLLTEETFDIKFPEHPNRDSQKNFEAMRLEDFNRYFPLYFEIGQNQITSVPLNLDDKTDFDKELINHESYLARYLAVYIPLDLLKPIVLKVFMTPEGDQEVSHENIRSISLSAYINLLHIKASSRSMCRSDNTFLAYRERYENEPDYQNAFNFVDTSAKDVLSSDDEKPQP